MMINDLMSTLRGDMSDQSGLTGFQPHSNSVYTFSGTVTYGSSLFQSVNLSEFFKGILDNLYTHRLNKLELRIKLRSYDATTVKSAFNVTVTTGQGDVGREHLLPVFNNMKLRLRLESFNENKLDPIASNLPLILWHPRYEQRRYVNAFASSLTHTVNLHNEFSPNRMIHRLYFYVVKNTTFGPADIVSHRDWGEDFTNIKVSLNGTVKEEYIGLNQFQRYLNKNTKNEYGHNCIVCGDPSANNVFALRPCFVPFLHFKNIHDDVLKHDAVVIFSGKDNSQNFDEITFIVGSTIANADLICIVESPVISEVFKDGSVKVSGK